MAESKIKGKEAIASKEFYLSSSSGWSSSQTFPTGFDASCQIIGFEVFLNSAWRSGQGIASASGRIFVEISSANKIRAFNDISELYGLKVRVTLLRQPS